MVKYKGDKGSLLFWSDMKGEWVEVAGQKKDYELKLNISAETGELMEKLKATTASISELGQTWQAMSETVGTSGLPYWGTHVHNPSVYPYPFDYDPVYHPATEKQVSISTPVVEAEFDKELHTLTFHVRVGVSEAELDAYGGCTTELGEVVGDMMKRQIVNLLLERNKERKEKGA